MTTYVRTPEFSQARILKPFAGFEEKYEGLDPSVYPIAMPGTLDPRAGKDGYDPNLLAGVPVPMGSKVKLWLPRLQSTQPYGGASAQDELSYRYLVVWRVRSLGEQTQDSSQQLVGHFGQTLQGVPQVPSNITAISSPGGRVVIPASISSVQIPNRAVDVNGTLGTKGQEFWSDNTTPAAVPGGVEGAYWPEPTVKNVTSEEYRVFPPNEWPAPLSPNYNGQVIDETGSGGGFACAKLGRAGLLSQGFYADANGTGTSYGADASGPLQNAAASRQAGLQSGPVFDVVNLEAEGDEMILLVYRPLKFRPQASETGWEFGDLDLPLSALFGRGTGESYPNVGAYLFTGSSAG